MDAQARAARRSWLLLIIDHNPFYLLSGACMLVGCYLLNLSLYDKAGNVRNLILLLGMVNVYELLLVILGLVLIRRARFVNDGRILLGLEALFLVDVTFTNGVISTVNANWGLLVGAAILLLAAIKLKVILSALKLPHSTRMGCFILLQLAAILGGPAIFKQIAMLHRGFLSASTVYAGYLVAGVILAVGAGLWRHPSGPIDPGRQYTLGRIFVAFPFISVLVHLYGAAWVYSVPFAWADLGPILLGLCLVIGASGSWLMDARLVLRIQMALLALAVWTSVTFPSSLLIALGHGFTLSPLRICLLCAGAIFLVRLWRQNRFACIFLGAISVLGVILGPTTAAIWSNLVWTCTALAAWIHHTTPRTTFQWGIAAVSMAFFTLALGGVFTWWKEVRSSRMPVPPPLPAGPIAEARI